MNIFTCFCRTVLIVFFILTFTVPFAVAQVVNIPDANLRARIEGLLSKNAGDAITMADLQTLTLLSAVNAGIRDLTGLEHATNLIWLELDNNEISDLTPLIPLTQLGGVYLDNNPLSVESVDKHIPVLLGRGVDVSYTLPSDVNGDGMVNIQDLVSVTQHFGSAGDLTADVNGDGIVSITDLTQVAGDMGETTVSEETTDTMDTADATDAVDTADTAPGQKPPRTEAFIFRKFLERLLSELKSVFPNFDYDVDTIFQTPGKGYVHPTERPCTSRGHHLRVLGIYIPDAIVRTTVEQIIRFSNEYKLKGTELIYLLRNIRRAKICINAPEHQPVTIPDENLRKAVVATINELGISMTGTPKEPTDVIYSGEMWRIEELKAKAAGIESLRGLEYATNLRELYLGNVYSQDWEVIIWTEEESRDKYTTTEPEMPNKISDLTPLENLTNLKVLRLGCNAVSDLSPLRNLTNLRWLSLHENRITDVSPLADLTNLYILDIFNYYYSPHWAGNNEITDLTPLRNLINLRALAVDHNPIGSSIDVVRNFPKLLGLSIRCCGVSNLRPLVESPGLQAGSYVDLLENPLTEADLGDIKALEARGVEVYPSSAPYPSEEGFYALTDVRIGPVFSNGVLGCSVSYRESFRAAPALQSQLRTEPDVLSSLWHDLSQVPEETSLLPNYPNPFNPETWIPYQLAVPTEVTVAIHAADGRLVRTLALGYQSAGVYQSKGRAAYWDGRNAQGEPVASGVYFYTLIAGDFTATRKLLIRK